MSWACSHFFEEEIGGSENSWNVPKVVPRGKWWTQDLNHHQAGSKCVVCNYNTVWAPGEQNLIFYYWASMAWFTGECYSHVRCGSPQGTEQISQNILADKIRIWGQNSSEC